MRFWHALGLATPPAGAAAVPVDIVAALPVVSEATHAWLGEESALGIARVIGSTSARIAEALVDAFRLGFEVPELTAGTSYSEVVEQYVEITRVSLPAFQEFVGAVVKAHLVRVASSTWSLDEDNLATGRELFVGFVDLVGYTALARTLTAGELAALVRRFEEVVADVVTTGGGRVVKLIGDGAMFAADAVADGCRIALALSDRLAEAESLPPARVGADCGPVVSLYGDYFGEVVDRAARLVALANPSTVVVSERVAAGGGRSFSFEQLPPQALKGFGAPAVTYRLLAR
jgi:adenylate cyclase